MSFLLLLYVHLVWTITAAVPDNPGTHGCQSLITVTRTNEMTHCTPWGNCTGLNCQRMDMNMNFSFAVDQCTDPLIGTFSVFNTTTGETVTQHSFNESYMYIANISGNYLKFEWGRNESHANVVLYYFQGDMIPPTEIFLNTSYCMCQSMEHIRDNLESPVDTDCQTDEMCAGVECNITVEGHAYLVDTEVYPCTEPPGFLYIVEDPYSHLVIFEEFFNHSRNVTLLGQPFYVEIRQLNYSFFIHGVLDVAGHPFDVIPETQVILDKSRCIEPPSVPVPTDTTPSSHVSKEMCNSMKQLASQAPPELGKCITNEACDTIICTTFNEYKSEFKLLPCDNPPSVGTTIIDPEGEVIYHQIVSNSSEIPLGPFGTTLYLTVSSEPGVMSIEVELGIPLFGRTAFIPKTDIPIDECQCVDISYSNRCLASSMSVTSLSLTSISSYNQTTSSSLTSTLLISSSLTSISSYNQATSSSLSGPSSRGAVTGSVSVIVSVSVVAFVIFFVIMVVVVVVIVIVRVKKRSSAYAFHPIAFDNDEDNDDQIKIT